MIFLLWCIIGSIHLSITVYLAAAFFKVEQHSKNQIDSFLSVVIAARNEEENLKRLIPKLLNQKHKNFEIIVALDRCTDRSKEYLKSINARHVHVIEIKEVLPEWNPKKLALHQAIKKSNGDWLVFTDADCIPASDHWLDLIVRKIGKGIEIIIGVSPYSCGSSLLSQYISYESFMTAFTYTSRAIQGHPYMAVGRNMAIKKSFFEKQKGYERIKSIKGGDDDLFIQSNANKNNTRVLIGAGSFVFTIPEQNWKSYFHQKLRHFSVGIRYKAKDKALLSIIHITQLIFIVGIPFAASHVNFWWMLLFYLFIKLVSYRFAASKLGGNINYMLLPLVDMLYAVLTPMVALWSKLVKDIPWKN